MLHRCVVGSLHGLTPTECVCLRPTRIVIWSTVVILLVRLLRDVFRPTESVHIVAVFACFASRWTGRRGRSSWAWTLLWWTANRTGLGTSRNFCMPTGKCVAWVNWCWSWIQVTIFPLLVQGSTAKQFPQGECRCWIHPLHTVGVNFRQSFHLDTMLFRKLWPKTLLFQLFNLINNW